MAKIYLKFCSRCGGDCTVEEGRDGKYVYKELVCIQCSHAVDYNKALTLIEWKGDGINGER